MMLIIILGLMVKLMSVSGDCGFGNQSVNDLDWEKLTGNRTWYGRSHTPHEVEDNFDCAEFTGGSPDGNRILLTAKVYDIRSQRHMITYGNITKWNSNGYYDVSHPLSLWNGRISFIAVDYDRYVILKFCHHESKEASIYVGYRQRHPDKATVEEVMKVMQDNNIDVSKLVDWKADHCQQT